MLALLAAALVGDLILLPALLAGPLGRLFSPSDKDRQRRARQKAQAAAGQPAAGSSDGPPAPAQTDRTETVPADEAAVSTADPPHMRGKSSSPAEKRVYRQDAPHPPRR
jgi:hypothetical protein